MCIVMMANPPYNNNPPLCQLIHSLTLCPTLRHFFCRSCEFWTCWPPQTIAGSLRPCTSSLSLWTPIYTKSFRYANPSCTRGHDSEAAVLQMKGQTTPRGREEQEGLEAVRLCVKTCVFASR